MRFLPMAMNRIAAPVAVVLLSACGGQRTPISSESKPEQTALQETAAELRRYEGLVRTQNAKAIAQLFTPAGNLQHVGQTPITGREKIEAFLDAFASYKVLVHEMRLTSAASAPFQVVQSGTYVQNVLGPEGQLISAKGWFLFEWQRQPDGRWLINSARTSSAPFVWDR
jgi:hypothetical protein